MSVFVCVLACSIFFGVGGWLVYLLASWEELGEAFGIFGARPDDPLPLPSGGEPEPGIQEVAAGSDCW